MLASIHPSSDIYTFLVDFTEAYDYIDSSIVFHVYDEHSMAYTSILIPCTNGTEPRVVTSINLW